MCPARRLRCCGMRSRGAWAWPGGAAAGTWSSLWRWLPGGLLRPCVGPRRWGRPRPTALTAGGR
eukprot:8090388-Prorocentrum_lima.AAC.1